MCNRARNLVQVYMDFLLGDWVDSESQHTQNIQDFFKLFCGLSVTVIILTYFYNILGQWIGTSIQWIISNLIEFQRKIKLLSCFQV